MTARNLTDADVKALADAMSASIIKTLKDPEVVGELMDPWSAYLDQKVGRGVRKAAFTVLMLLLAIAGTKLGAVDKFLEFLSHG